MTLPIELRPFDKEDWFTYAGCESENPMIAYCKDFTLVLDGEFVEVYRQTHTTDIGSSYSLTWKFPDHGTAMLFTLSVRGVEPNHILDAKAAVAGGQMVSQST